MNRENWELKEDELRKKYYLKKNILLVLVIPFLLFFSVGTYLWMFSVLIVEPVLLFICSVCLLILIEGLSIQAEIISGMLRRYYND